MYRESYLDEDSLSLGSQILVTQNCIYVMKYIVSESESSLGGRTRGGWSKSEGCWNGTLSVIGVGEDSRTTRGSRIRTGTSSGAFRPDDSVHRVDGRP